MERQLAKRRSGGKTASRVVKVEGLELRRGGPAVRLRSRDYMEEKGGRGGRHEGGDYEAPQESQGDACDVVLFLRPGDIK